MEYSLLLTFFTFWIFILLAAFFSSAETAFTSINKVKVYAMKSHHVKGASLLVSLLENRKRLLTAILIGNSFAHVAASALATATLLIILAQFGITEFAVAFALITGIVTLTLLVFGEITPKFLVLKHPERWALLYAKPISWVLILFYPLIQMLQGIIWVITKILRVPFDDAGNVLTTDEIKAMATLGQEEGLLEKEEQEMIHSIIEFSNTIVREIMTPRTDAVCIDVHSTVADCIDLITEKGHSRIPVYDSSIDNIVGVLYAKDLLKVPIEQRSSTLEGRSRETVFIPEFKNIEPLFHQMRHDKLHIAMVVDEHGGFSGLVTMEDIIEEIIGDIEDEFDHEESPEFLETSPNHFLVDGKMNIDDLGDKLGVDFPENEDYDTVGGFLLEAIGSFPSKGAHVSYQDLVFTVKEINERRILTVEIAKESKSATEVLLS